MRLKKFLAVLLCVSLTASSFTMAWADNDSDITSDTETSTESTEAEPTPVPQDSETIILDDEETATWADDTVTYSEVLNDYLNLGYESVGSDVRIDLPIASAKGSTDLKVEKVDGANAVSFTSDVDYVEWTFNVEKAGLYEMYVSYRNVVRYGMQIQRRICVDGEVPYKELNNIYLYRYYVEDGEVTTNAIGDEVWPKNKEIECWQTQGIYDYDGYFETPLQIYLSEGQHTIRMEYVDQEIYLGDAFLKGKDVYPTYAEVKAEYDAKGYKKADSKPIKFEAEVTASKSDSTIRRDSTTDPAASPTSAVNRLLNIMGGSRWSTGNQSITWEFEVENAGLYNINMRGLQNFTTGMPSYRQILIDGEIPFEEFVMYQFDYKEKWHAMTLADDEGNPYDFYFEPGTHSITMTVKSGFLYEVIEKSNDIVSDVSDAYLRVTKVITTDPDTNYEYNLNRNMPDMKEVFEKIADRLTECAEVLSEVTNFTTDMESDYIEMATTLYSFSEDLDLIVSNLSELEDIQTNLGTWMTEMGEMPLSFDYFELTPSGEEFEVSTSNFFQRFIYGVQNFLSSFTKQYDAVGSIVMNDSIDTVIEIWMARGTEWGEILKELIDESFTPDTGIGVNVNILPSGQLDAGNVSALMLAITSGVAPDVAMGISAAEPCEFAFRNAAVDLTQFDDFEEYYAENFYDTAKVSATYTKDGHDGVYALPETMDFKCVMYRKDIFQSLGLDVPKTWDDLFNTTLPVLYENQMSYSFPVDTSASSNTPAALVGMTMFLIQEGGQYYTDDSMYSALDTPEAYKAFKQWTDLYTSYGLDAQSSFFTRFRTGTLPIGECTYATYMQVLTQAPDLYGRWGIIPMIGTGTGEYDEDGNEIIDNRVGGLTSTTCAMMEQSENKEAAWEFLKWWMCEETQIKFGSEIEATMGVTARWASANIEAFKSLPWEEGDVEVIEEMLSKAEEQPVVLGGYMTARHLVNAWNRVYMQGQNPRDALEESVKEINKEIKAKRIEYGFSYDD